MTLPVAGWYDDPADAQRLRWWTGTEWSDATEHRRPEPPVAASVAEPAAAPQAEPTTQRPLPYGPASLTGGYGTPAAPAIPVPTPSTAPTPSSFAQLRRGNPLAFTGVLVGVAAFVFNPLGGPGLLALLFGIMGMVRASALKRRGAAVTGIGWAVSALALAAIVVLRGFLNLFGMAV
jgi:hypothetical protein